MRSTSERREATSTARVSAACGRSPSRRTYHRGGLVEVLWPLSSLLIAYAAWIDSSDERGFEIDGRPLLAVPVGCAVVAIGIDPHVARILVAHVREELEAGRAA